MRALYPIARNKVCGAQSTAVHNMSSILLALQSRCVVSQGLPQGDTLLQRQLSGLLERHSDVIFCDVCELFSDGKPFVLQQLGCFCVKSTFLRPFMDRGSWNYETGTLLLQQNNNNKTATGCYYYCYQNKTKKAHIHTQKQQIIKEETFWMSVLLKENV